MVTLGEMISLATRRGATMGKFDFYGSLDRWKMHLRQLRALRC